jgi:5,5'-dehydrodivanillate O-demethylase
MLRTGRRGNEVRLSLHYMPNCTRVIVPPMAGLEGAGGWRELYLAFTPVDDETNMWFITNHVRVTGAAADSYLEKREQYLRRQGGPGSAVALAQEVMAGRVPFADIDHPDRVRVQDIAVQAGQGRIADRSNERLGRSDLAIILWRRMLERELRAMDEGGPVKEWTPAPAAIVPTLGF